MREVSTPAKIINPSVLHGTHRMPADLVRREIEQRAMLVGNVLVLVPEIHFRAIVASHLSHTLGNHSEITALHWKTRRRAFGTSVLSF